MSHAAALVFDATDRLIYLLGTAGHTHHIAYVMAE